MLYTLLEGVTVTVSHICYADMLQLLCSTRQPPRRCDCDCHTYPRRSDVFFSLPCFFLCRKKHVEKKKTRMLVARIMTCFFPIVPPICFSFLARRGRGLSMRKEVELHSDLNPKPQTPNPKPSTLKPLSSNSSSFRIPPSVWL
jgi:hypothetical protein